MTEEGKIQVTTWVSPKNLTHVATNPDAPFTPMHWVWQTETPLAHLVTGEFIFDWVDWTAMDELFGLNLGLADRVRAANRRLLARKRNKRGHR